MSVHEAEGRLIRLRRVSVVASILVTSSLVVAKLVLWIQGDSVAVLSSLLDSTFDAISVALTAVSVFHAARPADHNHRFGHSKAEPLAAFAQSIFIAASAVFVAYESLDRFLHPAPVTHTREGVVLMVAASVALIALIAFQRYVLRRTDSLAIEADSLNYSGDLVLNAGVIGALVLAEHFDAAWIDPSFGLAIAGALIWNAIRIGARSHSVLMDEELDAEIREGIRTIAMQHPESLGIHDLRSRHSGDTMFVELHLELDGKMSLERAHDIATEIEERITVTYGRIQITIHQEPHGIDDEKLDHRVGAP